MGSCLAPIPDYEVYLDMRGLAQAAPPAGSIVLIWEDRCLVRFWLRPGDIETCDNGRSMEERLL